MNFITYNEFKRDILNWSEQHPEFRDFDAIVGIERSGVLPATILALHLNKPLLTVSDCLRGINSYVDSKVKLGEIKKLLVVDDSISSGRAMNKVKQVLKGYQAKYGAVYGVSGSQVDYMYKEVSLPRAFEWNLFHNDILKDTLMDIDGVVFKEPPCEDYIEEYGEYLANPIPLHIPTVRVKGFVTGRLEKYRDITEQTLKRYGIEYDSLAMAYYDTPQERRERDMGVSKANIYKLSGAKLFIESSHKQANTIRAISGKQVICIEEL